MSSDDGYDLTKPLLPQFEAQGIDFFTAAEVAEISETQLRKSRQARLLILGFIRELARAHSNLDPIEKKKARARVVAHLTRYHDALQLAT